MMGYAIGFVGGVAWCLGAFITMSVTGWIGPMSLALVGWPAILVWDGVQRVCNRIDAWAWKRKSKSARAAKVSRG